MRTLSSNTSSMKYRLSKIVRMVVVLACLLLAVPAASARHHVLCQPAWTLCRAKGTGPVACFPAVITSLKGPRLVVLTPRRAPGVGFFGHRGDPKRDITSAAA